MSTQTFLLLGSAFALFNTGRTVFPGHFIVNLFEGVDQEALRFTFHVSRFTFHVSRFTSPSPTPDVRCLVGSGLDQS